jgi:hypothetical protein
MQTIWRLPDTSRFHFAGKNTHLSTVLESKLANFPIGHGWRSNYLGPVVVQEVNTRMQVFRAFACICDCYVIMPGPERSLYVVAEFDC